MFLRFGSLPTIVISSSELAKCFFKHNDVAFANRPRSAMGKYMAYNNSDLAFSPYGDYWRQMRKLCVMELLTAKSVDSFKEVRRREVESMVSRIFEESRGGTAAVNLREVLSRLSTDVTWSVLAGRIFSDEELVGGQNMTFKRLVEEMNAAGSGINMGDFMPWLDWLDVQGIRRRYVKLSAVFDAFAEKLIRDRLAERHRHGVAEYKPKCFVDVLLSVFQKTELSSDDRQKIKALLFDMSTGGTETTATTMEWTMSLLLKHPQSMQRLQEEIDTMVGRDRKVREEDIAKLKYLQWVLKESMRLYPALPLGVAHLCREDTEVCGYNVAKGTALFLNLSAIGRDPLVWGDDADEFKPERFCEQQPLDFSGQADMKSIPFSAGRRGCPGAPMALPFVLFAIASLVQRFDWKALDDGFDMEERPGLSVPRQNPLVARPTLRKSDSVAST